MVLIKQVQLYRNLFSKSFFFDKFLLNNVYQYPKINSLELKFSNLSQLGLNKIKFCKIVLLFYLLTGQQPQLLIKNCNLRNIKRKKIVGLVLTMHQYDYFFNFLIQRQLALMSSFFPAFLLTQESTFTFEVTQKVQDDDILFQVLKVSDVLKYQVCLKSTSLLKSHLQSLLINLKIPCKK
jgi:hypothetical protein